MSTPEIPPSSGSGSPKDRTGKRQDRLKSALRENLKRRKAQGRVRTVEPPPDDQESQSD